MIVETVSGRIEGHQVTAPGGELVLRFLGVPYAAPPVGDLRFRGPEPAVPWTGIRPAHEFGPAAPQADGVRSRLPSFSVANTSEDCLTLNVWTPAPPNSGADTARPVMVWLHGGSYMIGGSAMDVFDAGRLATEGDVVVVTVNYRLGALGYLVADPDSDAADSNCGLRDQLAALQWVRAHAAEFGGDPDRITVFGESAGAGSTLHLCVARTPPPVCRAIVQSGEPRTLTLELAHRVRDGLGAQLHVAPNDFDALRAVPVDALITAQNRVFAEHGFATGLMPFHPTFDDLVDLDPIHGFQAGRASAVDLIIGNTRDELRLFVDPRARDLDDAGLAPMLARLGNDRIDLARIDPVRIDPADVIAAYRSERPGCSAAEIWEAARTDSVLRVPALQAADAHAAAGAPTFVYRFDWEAPEIGAAHAVDVPFTFGTFDRGGWGEAVGANADADALSRQIRAAWCAFAHDGDPSHSGIGVWPQYDPITRPTMMFAAPCRLEHDPAGRSRSVWST